MGSGSASVAGWFASDPARPLSRSQRKSGTRYDADLIAAAVASVALAPVLRAVLALDADHSVALADRARLLLDHTDLLPQRARNVKQGSFQDSIIVT